MPAYRLYHLDGVGRVIGAEWIAADDDKQAVIYVRERKFVAACELWERDRLVERFGLNPLFDAS
jgi:hypothetical protein